MPAAAAGRSSASAPTSWATTKTDRTKRFISDRRVRVARGGFFRGSRSERPGYLVSCREDIEVRTRFASIAGLYEGPDGVRRYFAQRTRAPTFGSSSDTWRR